jgi:hypothetical protein
MIPDDPNNTQPLPTEPTPPDFEPPVDFRQKYKHLDFEETITDSASAAVIPPDEPLDDDTDILERRAVLPDDPTLIDTAPPQEPAVTESIPPVSSALPRILAETPLGGQVRPLITPPTEPPTPTLPPITPPRLSDDAPAAAITPPLDDTQESVSTVPDPGLSIDQLREQIREAAAAKTELIPVVDESPAAPGDSVPPAAGPETPPELPAALAPPAAPVAPAEVRSTGPALTPAAAPISPRAEWDTDDDLSPELAAVLFGQRGAADSAPPAERPAAAETQRLPEVPAGPVKLTAVDDAHRLPLVAQDHTAAAPDAPLNGKVRYTRIEEPLKNDAGQRIQERWEYFKPDYPGLSGRLVREVRSEEKRFADGSWAWQYERSYTDGGRDRREVRTNTDHTYIERGDEVSVRDEAGKRQAFREQAALILAEPEREEKRGFLSGLFGRDDDQEDAPAPKTWRDATHQETKRARKQGGQAFR